MVKRLRHHPFTVVSWVRIPLGSPYQIKYEPLWFVFFIFIEASTPFANGEQYRLDVLQEALIAFDNLAEYKHSEESFALKEGNVHIDREGIIAVDSPAVAKITCRKSA